MRILNCAGPSVEKTQQEERELGTTNHDEQLSSIARRGFTIVPNVFSNREVDALVSDLQSAFEENHEKSDSVRARDGGVYAARNVISLVPITKQCWRRQPLLSLLGTVLGAEYGLVRGLYFDKPPDQTWSLPWHRDLTIAVENNQLKSDQFHKPTTKAGVPHVEAAREILEQMLTLRIHLDDVVDENGPLLVIPGSHDSGGKVFPDAEASEPIYACQGDVLAIRPLVSHSSVCSHPNNQRHRRIIHLEFSGCKRLSDGYKWHDWISA